MQVNLCRVFKLAKEVAASGKPLNYMVLPMMDADGARFRVSFWLVLCIFFGGMCEEPV